MLGKVLMCPCYVEYFYQEWNEYVKKLFHFSTLVSLNDYLKNELTKCKPFFYFFNQKVNIKLDNLFEKYMNDIRKAD